MKVSSRIALAGFAAAALHLIFFKVLVSSTNGQEFAVRVPSSLVLTDDGVLDAKAVIHPKLRSRTTTLLDGKERKLGDAEKVATGVHRLQWQVSYRGGHEQIVGLSSLAGPFQSASDPACGIRLHVNQALLDDGEGSPGTLAYMSRMELQREILGRLPGQPIYVRKYLGGFRSIKELSLRWSAEEGGKLLAKLVLVFREAKVTARMSVTIGLKDGQLTLTPKVKANVGTHGIRGWISGYASDEATDLGQSYARLLAKTLERWMTQLPQTALHGSSKLQLQFCRDQEVLVTDKAATVPLAVVGLNKVPQAIVLREPDFPTPHTSAPISLTVDLSSANGILHSLWASGYLDHKLNEADLAGWFNNNEMVQKMLSLRLAGLHTTMPPVLELDESSDFALSAEIGATFHDGELRTPARLFTRIGLNVSPSVIGDNKLELLPSNLDLTCEPEPGRLVSCYEILVEVARTHALKQFEPLSKSLSETLAGLSQNKEVIPKGIGTSLNVDHITMTPGRHEPSGWLRVDVFGALEVKGDVAH